MRKPKQRPRPEPLIIPTKAGTFIAPSVYPNITPYQSHLRSPVRLADHPSERSFELPPYTPPPILSPVREGSGLYFNAIISTNSIPAPPPITPKSAHRTLLRSSECPGGCGGGECGGKAVQSLGGCGTAGGWKRNSPVSSRGGGVRHGPPAWILTPVLLFTIISLGRVQLPKPHSVFSLFSRDSIGHIWLMVELL